MRFLSTFSLLLSVASAAKVSLSFTLDPGKDISSVVIYHRNGAVIMGRCGRRINTKVPIDFSDITVNKDRTRSPFGNYMKEGRSQLPITNGNFTVGKATYAIQPDPVFSGGPSCNTDVDPVTNRVLVHCMELYWDYTDIINNTATVDTDCFGPFPPVRDELETDYYTKEEKADYYEKNHLMSKIDRRCDNKHFPTLDGTGWPHQRFLYEQVSDVIECGKDRDCCTGHSNSYTLAIGLSVSIALGVEVKDLFTLTTTYGYSVTDSWTTGNTYTCHGKPGDRVCVWYKVAHTALTFRSTTKKKRSKTRCHNWDKQFIATLPNRNNEGGEFTCKYNNECRSIGDRYWDCYGRQDQDLKYCPPPGHPPKLQLDKGPLPQCLEQMASKKARNEKWESMSGKEWKAFEKQEKEEHKRLKKEYNERIKIIKDREKVQEKNMEDEEKKKKGKGKGKGKKGN